MSESVISTNTKTRTRTEHIEILRIIACFLVIFNHTNERGFYRYISDTPGSFLWVFNLVSSIICKSAVPIFFMISGALLLKKTESVKKTYSRATKIVIDLIFFSFVYFGVDAYLTNQDFSFGQTLKTMVQINYWHLWYLYAYIMLILTLPFFRDFAQNLKLDNFKVMYVLAIVCMGFLPIIENYVIGINYHLKTTWITINIFIYPLLGYVLENCVDVNKIGKRFLTIAWAFNFLCFIISIVAEYYYVKQNPGNNNETFLCAFCIVNAPLVYITVKWISNRLALSKVLSKLIMEIGKCTFGIYLLHILFLWRIQPAYRFWISRIEVGHLGSVLGVYVSCILVFIISGTLTYVLRKIPILKYLF